MHPYKLQQLGGLNFKQSTIYLALLDAKKATVSDIVHKTDMDKKSVYEILRDFEKQGFIKRTENSSKPVMYEMLPPKKLIQMYEKQRKNAEDQYEIARVAGEKIGQIYKKMNSFEVHTLTKKEELDALNTELAKNPAPLCSMVDWDTYLEAEGRPAEFLPYARERKGKNYVIAATHKTALLERKRENNVFFIPAKEYPFQGICSTIGERVIVTLRRNPQAKNMRTFFIDEPELAKVMRSFFRMMLFGVRAKYNGDISKDFIDSLK